MKIKIKKKNPENLMDGLRSIVAKPDNVMPCLFAMDTKGNLIVEGFKKLLDYTADKITLEAGGRQIYIKGSELTIVSCSRYNISIQGGITSIELFEVK